MNDYLANLAFAYLPLLVVAVLAWWGMLRWLDKLGAINFRRAVLPVILRSALGTAVYFGLRLLAVAFVVSAVLSAVRF